MSGRLNKAFAAFLGLLVLTWSLSAQVVRPTVRVGFRNDTQLPVLIRDLSQPFAPPIRLGPKETVWDRLPANAQIPVAVADAVTGQVLYKGILLVPPKGSVLYIIQVSPNGSVTITPQFIP